MFTQLHMKFPLMVNFTDWSVTVANIHVLLLVCTVLDYASLIAPFTNILYKTIY